MYDVHDSDTNLREAGSAKLFVKSNGDTVVEEKGILRNWELRGIQAFVKENYKEMYMKWSALSKESFFEK